MKKLLPLLILLLYTVSSFAQTNYYSKSRTFKLSATASKRDYLQGVVIVKFKEISSPGARTLSSGPVVNLKSAVVSSLTPKFPEEVSKNRTSVLKDIDPVGLNRIYELRFSGDAGIETVINELLKDKNIEYAEPSYVAHLNYVPDDPYYSSRQSYLDQVKAPEAWNVIRNANGVVIGIVDSGSELTHEDLAANILGGWDLVGASADNFTEDNNPNVISSANDHGVHVSGLASAVSNNGKGIASIASDARLYIVKVAADNEPENIYRGFDGIKYAADHGANIINCSWGSQDRSFYGEDIVNYAISKGCLIVAAAGNNNVTTPDYPAGYKGVVAVANVLSDDKKSSSSNYGGYVSISAPGEQIYSTTFHNSYDYKRGTSMASPIVASAAALVKAKYPDLSMQQVGELVRVTADNIDGKNPAYAGKIGKGRLNVYRALTETSPAVRVQNVLAKDDNNGRFTAGSTISIYLDLKNFLAPVSDLQVSLKSSDPDVSVLNSGVNAGSIGTLESKSMVGPFNVYIEPGISDNSPVEFNVEYSSAGSAYQDYETFTLVVALDYMNVLTDNLATTATSNGRIGFSSNGQSGGLGFQYKGTQLLYEASLMIGRKVSDTDIRVSNNTRSSDESADNHFVKRVAVKGVLTDSTVSGSSEFDDSGNPNGLKIDVKHTLSARRNTGEDKYVIAEYEVINRNAGDLQGVYIGLFNDWDIDDEAANATRYDALNRIAYAYSTKSASAPYAGVKFLTAFATPAYYPMSLSSGLLSDGTFTTSEKYEVLSSGIKSTGSGSSGADISFVSGYGPFTIPANGSVKVAFAYGGGDNLDDLKANLAVAQDIYNRKNISAASSSVLYTYPNPVTPYYNNNVATVVNLPENAVVSLDLFNIAGQKVKTFIKDISLDKGLHTMYYNFADIGSGIYILRLYYNNSVKTHKISVIR